MDFFVGKFCININCHYSRFELVTAGLLKYHVIRNMTPYHWASGTLRFERHYCLQPHGKQGKMQW